MKLHGAFQWQTRLFLHRVRTASTCFQYRLASRLGFMALALLASACSTVLPWQATPLTSADAANPELSPEIVLRTDPSLFVAVTFSGGGARAAAFGYGVLDAMRATQIEWKGRSQTLLEQVDLVGGVSGGSIIATYYAAFGNKTFERFQPDYLRRDFQRTLLHNVFSPSSLWKLSSPWYGRTHLLMRDLDELFEGKTYGDIFNNGHARLLVSATDLSRGAPFEFSPSQFNFLCTDLTRVPLSFAVAASAAVPILLSPMTLKNNADKCALGAPEIVQAFDNLNADVRLFNLRSDLVSYADVTRRPYIHLVDGGIADNLGVRRILDRIVAGWTLRIEGEAAKRALQRIVLIVVNAERDPEDAIDLKETVPGVFSVADALLFGAGARATNETIAQIQDLERQWPRMVSALHERSGGLVAPDAKLNAIVLNLRDAADGRFQTTPTLLKIPTAFTIETRDVDELIAAGRSVFHNAPAVAKLKRELSAH